MPSAPKCPVLPGRFLWHPCRMARRRNSGSRRYPRTARLNEVLREIIATEIERIDDERLGFFTVTAVEVDPGIEQAKVYWSDIGADDAVVLEVLEEHRPRLQRVVNEQTHMRRTPILSFHVDEVGRSASRIDEILANLDTGGPDDEAEVEGDVAADDESESSGPDDASPTGS